MQHNGCEDLVDDLLDEEADSYGDEHGVRAQRRVCLPQERLQRIASCHFKERNQARGEGGKHLALVLELNGSKGLAQQHGAYHVA